MDREHSQVSSRDDQDFWVQPAIEIGQEIRLASAMNPSVTCVEGVKRWLVLLPHQRVIAWGQTDREVQVLASWTGGLRKTWQACAKEACGAHQGRSSASSDATIDHDEHGHRFTRVTSAAEKIQLGSSPMIQMVTDPSVNRSTLFRGRFVGQSV